MEYRVRRAILHILDTNGALPVYSQQTLDLAEETVTNFILTHVKKINEDDAAKKAAFQEGSLVRSEAGQLTDAFVESSGAIAAHLYGLLKEHCEIPGADLLAALVEIDEVPHLALIKFNYRQGYTHYVDYGEDGTSNKIVLHKVIFASESQKVEEGALINLRTWGVRLVEKTYEINGEPLNYFSALFLNCDTELSQRESVKVIQSAARKIARQYYDDDFAKVSAVKTAIYDGIEENGSVTLETVAGACFKEDPAVRQEYVQAVRQAGVAERLTFAGETPERKFSKQRLKTDSGIELTMPMEVYKNKEMVEFVNSFDGTVSIILKNVGKISSR